MCQYELRRKEQRTVSHARSLSMDITPSRNISGLMMGVAPHKKSPEDDLPLQEYIIRWVIPIKDALTSAYALNRPIFSSDFTIGKTRMLYGTGITETALITAFCCPQKSLYFLQRHLFTQKVTSTIPVCFGTKSSSEYRETLGTFHRSIRFDLKYNRNSIKTQVLLCQECKNFTRVP